MRVKFLRDEQFECEGRYIGPTYKAGEVHDFTDEFAGRWIRRNAAVEVADEPAATSPAEPPPAAIGADLVEATPPTEPPARGRSRRYR